MKFHELAVGEKFKYNNKEYLKLQEVKASCCTVKHNCEIIETNEKAVLKPLDEVEKIESN